MKCHCVFLQGVLSEDALPKLKPLPRSKRSSSRMYINKHAYHLFIMCVCVLVFSVVLVNPNQLPFSMVFRILVNQAKTD